MTKEIIVTDVNLHEAFFLILCAIFGSMIVKTLLHLDVR